jgi:glycerophosphoryl diester phosphodiesterase
MTSFNVLFTRIERRLHPKIKEGIAKTLVYYFTFKEIRTYQSAKYKQTSHVFDNYAGLIKLAHRGFSGVYPENTVLAFQKALEAGADGVELDVQLTQDGEIIVCHDPQLQRLIGQASFVRDLPYDRLQHEGVAACQSPETSGAYFPTLAMVFSQLPTDTLINIEIKHEATSFFNWDTEKAVLQCVRQYGQAQRVVISAFNPMIVNRVRKLDPEISTAYLITQTLNPLLIFLLSRVRAGYLHVDMRYLSPQRLRHLKQKGLKVLGYTLNTAAEYAQACELGLQGVITDYPDRLNAFLDTLDPR